MYNLVLRQRKESKQKPLLLATFGRNQYEIAKRLAAPYAYHPKIVLCVYHRDLLVYHPDHR